MGSCQSMLYHANGGEFVVGFTIESSKLRKFSHCAECGVEEAVLRQFRTCAGCMQVKYCSRAHQKKHWPEHKPTCRKNRHGKAKPHNHSHK